MAALDDIKTLTGNSNENLINIYIRRASTAIKGYLHCSDSVDIATVYIDAVVEYVIECLNRKGDEGIKQSQIGSVQNTYETGISDEVKALLPPPFVKMMG